MSAYGVDNLASLPELDENVLLEELRVRYEQNIVYVSCLNSDFGQLNLPLVKWSYF